MMKYIFLCSLFLLSSCTSINNRGRNPASWFRIDPAKITLPATDKLEMDDSRSYPGCELKRGIYLCTDKRIRELISFKISNYSSPNINPTGTGEIDSIPRREYTFSFNERARQSIFLEMFEQGDSSGRDRDTKLFSHLYFFPRKVIPAVKEIDDKYLEVTISTGEKIIFDKLSHEIIDGVIDERSTINIESTARRKQFSKLDYLGDGVMLRFDSRGVAPNSKIFWGREQEKEIAIVTHGARICRVKSSLLWDKHTRGNKTKFKFSSDKEFNRAILQKICKWTDILF